MLEARLGLEPTENPQGGGRRRRDVLDFDVCCFRACLSLWSRPAARSGKGATFTGEQQRYDIPGIDRFRTSY